MSSHIRTLERSIIRHRCYKRDGNTKAFHKEWYDYHYGRDEAADKNGSLTVARRQKNFNRMANAIRGGRRIGLLRQLANLLKGKNQ